MIVKLKYVVVASALFAIMALNHQGVAIIIALMLLVYFVVEFGWGGGDPNHKDHNRPPGYM